MFCCYKTVHCEFRTMRMVFLKEATGLFFLCSLDQRQRTCLAACCVFLAQAQFCWTLMDPPSPRPRVKPGAWRSFPATQVGDRVHVAFWFYAWLKFLRRTPTCIWTFTHPCVGFVCIVGDGTAGAPVLHSIHKNVCIHLSSYLRALACLSGQICPCQ